MFWFDPRYFFITLPAVLLALLYFALLLFGGRHNI